VPRKDSATYAGASCSTHQPPGLALQAETWYASLRATLTFQASSVCTGGRSINRLVHTRCARRQPDGEQQERLADAETARPCGCLSPVPRRVARRVLREGAAAKRPPYSTGQGRAPRHGARRRPCPHSPSAAVNCASRGRRSTGARHGERPESSRARAKSRRYARLGNLEFAQLMRAEQADLRCHAFSSCLLLRCASGLTVTRAARSSVARALRGGARPRGEVSNRLH